MKPYLSKLSAATLLAACAATSVGCYPAYPPPYQSAAPPEYQEFTGGSDPIEPLPQEPMGPPPAPYGANPGVNPGVAIAGAAAAGLLGYALGSNRGYYSYPYFGRGFYAPVPFGYRRGFYAPGCY